MTANNPAYKTGNYVPGPTPIPDDWQVQLEQEEEEKPESDVAEAEPDADGETDHEDSPEASQPDPATSTRRQRAAAARSSPTSNSKNPRASSTPAVQDAEGAGESFEGDSFQQAQEKIVTEMINLKNDEYAYSTAIPALPLMRPPSGELVSGAFLNLPSRELRDYYRVIRHPVCLRSVQKLVRGVKGREKPTGHTLLKSWQALEDESSYIWNNAREYNEDGSVISELAGQLEVSPILSTSLTAVDRR